MQRLCPRCGQPIKAKARFCPHCGVALAPKPKKKVKRCPSCGAPVRAAAQFCGNCGDQLKSKPKLLEPVDKIGIFGTGDLPPLTELAGRYRIMEKIAQGGMGAVYKAQDKRLDKKTVAVKEMSELAVEKSDRTRVLEAFQREAELLARLKHPNLVQVSDRFQNGDRHYMVMEFIAGETLRDILEGRSDPFPEEQVLIWADQLCDVLSYLHSHKPKIIYRDIKPANVMVVSGADTVKLIDFGITRFYKPGKKKDTIEFGTDGYAPPEQYGKAQTDERADVYALGATLHQLLTLHDPVTTPFKFPAVRKLNPDVSPRVEKAIAKAVKDSQKKRHQSMAEMRQALTGTVKAQGQQKRRAQLLECGRVTAASGIRDYATTIAPPDGKQASLSADEPWLDVQPRTIKDSQEVTVIVNTALLEPGRLEMDGSWFKRWVGWHTRRFVPSERVCGGLVQVKSKGGPETQVLVEVNLIPQPGQVAFGWLKTIGAMLLEATIVIGALIALI